MVGSFKADGSFSKLYAIKLSRINQFITVLRPSHWNTVLYEILVKIELIKITD